MFDLTQDLQEHLARIASPCRAAALLLIAVIAPMLTGIVVRTFAWMTCSRTAASLTPRCSPGLEREPLRLMYNELGTIVALVHIYVPSSC